MCCLSVLSQKVVIPLKWIPRFPKRYHKFCIGFSHVHNISQLIFRTCCRTCCSCQEGVNKDLTELKASEAKRKNVFEAMECLSSGVPRNSGTSRWFSKIDP